MQYNEVTFYGAKLLGISEDTVTPETLKKGVTAHDASGTPIVGTMEAGTDTSDATAEASDILAGKTAYVASGKATGTMPAVEQATPSVSVDSATGLVTATAEQAAGYVAAGSKSATLQLPTKAAATITPGTVDQVVPAGRYLTGAQTVAGDANLLAANIKSGVSIFGVAGRFGEGLRNVTAAVSPAGAGTVTGAGLVQDGMTVTLRASAGEGYLFSHWEVNGENIGISSTYTFTVTENVTVTAVCVEVVAACLVFSSDSDFTLKTRNSTKNWNGTLEYSVDGSTWMTWDGATALSSTNGILYLRGTGNTYLTTGAVTSNTQWVLTGSDIACSGNIENLLDYASVVVGNHPAMAAYCFRNLFFGCAALTMAPELPATTLTEYCYQNMFVNCTALKVAPALPATILEAVCYGAMFSGCTALKLSTTQTGEYQYPFRIPSEGTGMTATNALQNMFTNTGGTFTGTPSINTTYYTTAEVVG